MSYRRAQVRQADWCLRGLFLDLGAGLRGKGPRLPYLDEFDEKRYPLNGEWRRCVETAPGSQRPADFRESGRDDRGR